jgi:hypothetical protein
MFGSFVHAAQFIGSRSEHLDRLFWGLAVAYTPHWVSPISFLKQNL